MYSALYVSVSCCNVEMNKKLSKKKALAKHLPLLKLLSNLGSEEERDRLLEALNHDCCDSIYEVLKQGLKNDSMPSEWRKELQGRLSGKEKFFRSLIGPKKVSRARRHKTLIQVGGDASYIIRSVLPMLESYLASNRK